MYVQYVCVSWQWCISALQQTVVQLPSANDESRLACALVRLFSPHAQNSHGPVRYQILIYAGAGAQTAQAAQSCTSCTSYTTDRGELN